MRNYRNAILVPPSPASRTFGCEVTLHKDDHANGHVFDGQVARTREVVQATDAADQANMRNKENRKAYESQYKMLGKRWWKKDCA